MAIVIVLKETNAVVDTAETLTYEEINGITSAVTDKLAYFNYENLDFTTVAVGHTIPSDFVPHKYFYTLADGFVLNTNWKPYVPVEQVAEEANAKATDLEDMMAQVLLILASNNLN